MNQARTHIGVDVGKDCLDICHPDGTKEHVGNTKRCRARLIRKAKTTSAIISFEATGPYEEPLADECLWGWPPPGGSKAHGACRSGMIALTKETYRKADAVSRKKYTIGKAPYAHLDFTMRLALERA